MTDFSLDLLLTIEDERAIHARETKWLLVLQNKRLVSLAARHSGIYVASPGDFPTGVLTIIDQ